MDEEFLLLNPGPVRVSRAVLEAMAEPMVSHRSAAFGETYARAQAGLEYVFEHSALDGSRTSAGGTTLVLNGTATMAMEAAVSNLVDPGDEVVSLVNGKFGERFADIAGRYADCTPVAVDWGEPFDLDAVAAAITDETALVTMVHNETSTGLLNPVEAVGELAAAHDARFVVDGVTSLGGDEFLVDDWGVDVAVTDAQKALAAPPGLSAMYLADHALDAIDGDRGPYYHDLDWHVRKAADGQTPFTSAVPLFRAMAAAVDAIREEGMADRIARHRRYAAAVRAGVTAFGLDPFPTLGPGSAYSNTVTAVALPEPLVDDAGAFFDAVAERNVSIAGGQAHLGGRIFRVANMGELSAEDVLRGVRTVGDALGDAGVDAPVDDGVAAAEAELSD